MNLYILPDHPSPRAPIPPFCTSSEYKVDVGQRGDAAAALTGLEPDLSSAASPLCDPGQGTSCL